MPQPEITTPKNLMVVVVVPQPEAQPLKKELVVVVVPQPEAQPLKVHPKTCHIWFYAENALKLRKIRTLKNYAHPHHHILTDALL